MAVSAIPEGYQAITPYLIVKGADEAIDFYRKVLGASERMRLEGPDGKVMHAELQFGASVVMLADEFPAMGCLSPQTLGNTGVSVLLYVEQVDKVFAQALAAGAKELRPVKDQFYGDRSGTLQDPFGHIWTVATHIENLTPEQIRQRAQAFFEQA